MVSGEETDVDEDAEVGEDIDVDISVVTVALEHRVNDEIDCPRALELVS